jgi:hypothetical protein
MKRMKVSFGVATLVAIGIVGCDKGAANNMPVPPVAKTTAPAAENANSVNPNIKSPEATNSAPTTTKKEAEAGNTAPIASNNAPIDQAKKNKKPTPIIPQKKDKPKVKFDDPAAAGKGGWKASDLSARKLIESVDAHMKLVTNSKMAINMVADVPYGDKVGQGMVNVENVIADQNRFCLLYADFVPGGRPHFESHQVVRALDGKGYMTLVGEKYQAGRIEPDQDVLKGWVLNSTHYFSSGIGTSRKPLTELIEAAQKAKWNLKVEDKKFGTSSFRRVIMESPKEPKTRMELLIHPEKLLPVSFSAVVYGTKKTSSGLEIQWLKSDKPLTDADLTGKVKTAPVNAMSKAEAEKRGFKPSG